MTSEKKFSIKALPDLILARLEPLRRYSLLVFIIFLAGLYGFVLLRIHNLNNAQPSSDAVSSQVKAAHVIHIDQSVVRQLQSLQDNSVSVNSLFDQARSNPF